MFKRLKQALWILWHEEIIRKAFPDGHFYSPIVDTGETLRDELRIWPVNPEILGINFNDPEQQRWLSEIVPRHLAAYDYQDSPTIDTLPYDFYTKNTQFSGLDARMLFVFLIHLQPQRIIEVGSGFSSLLIADVNRRFLGGKLDFSCIEPYPRNFLQNGVPGVTRLIQRKVQEIMPSEFSRLENGDILFIDSSHVAKTGSDVNHLYFEILPRLAVGVIIHIHDIFFPHDYPKEWVVSEGRNWNEQYLVRALLMYSGGFEVLFGCAYVQTRFPDLLTRTFDGNSYGGGSLWLRKIR